MSVSHVQWLNTKFIQCNSPLHLFYSDDLNGYQNWFIDINVGYTILVLVKITK